MIMIIFIQKTTFFYTDKKVSETGLNVNKFKSKEKERRCTAPQGGGKIDQGESDKEKEGDGRKIQRGGEQGESRGGERNRNSSEKNLLC